MRPTLLLVSLGTMAGVAAACPWDAVAQRGGPTMAPAVSSACTKPNDPNAMRRVQRDIAEAEQLPMGRQRQQMLQQAARSYARQDPETALVWARNLQPPEPGLVGAVFDAVAECEPMRAFDLAMTLESAVERTQTLRGVLARGGSNSDEQARALADRILETQDASERDVLLQALVSSWALSHPHSATDWLLTHAERTARAFSAVAQRLGEVDPAAAASYLDRVPDGARAAWITAVARGYARTDLQAALNFMAQFRDDPGYDSVVGGVAQTLAQYDPTAAARLLDGVDITVGMNAGAAMITGQQWALRDPAPAAYWALQLSERGARLGTVMSVAQLWARSDLQAARTWVLSLASGENRDAALRGLLMELIAWQLPDAELVAAFSSETAKQQILAVSVIRAAQQNPENALRVVETYITDPDTRAQAKKSIEIGARIRASMSPGAPALPPAVGPSPTERFPPWD